MLFHFAAKENFVIFLPQDGRPGKLFDLKLTRGQVKEAASRGEPLMLNDALVKLVQDERRAGRLVDISFGDVASRAADDRDALSDAEWPFGNLDLNDARK